MYYKMLKSRERFMKMSSALRGSPMVRCIEIWKRRIRDNVQKICKYQQNSYHWDIIYLGKCGKLSTVWEHKREGKHKRMRDDRWCKLWLGRIINFKLFVWVYIIYSKTYLFGKGVNHRQNVGEQKFRN